MSNFDPRHFKLSAAMPINLQGVRTKQDFVAAVNAELEKEYGVELTGSLKKGLKGFFDKVIKPNLTAQRRTCEFGPEAVDTMRQGKSFTPGSGTVH